MHKRSRVFPLPKKLLRLNLLEFVVNAIFKLSLAYLKDSRVNSIQLVKILIRDIKHYLAIKQIIYLCWQLFIVNNFTMPTKHDFSGELNPFCDRNAYDLLNLIAGCDIRKDIHLIPLKIG